jgi:hypothetical protein
MKTSLESWEKAPIRKFLLQAVVGGLVGVIVMGIVSIILKSNGWGSASSGLLGIPWIIVLVLMIPQAYHQGVSDERERNIHSITSERREV